MEDITQFGLLTPPYVLHRLRGLLASILPIVVHLTVKILQLSSSHSSENSSFVCDATVQGRVLCTRCREENDDDLLFRNDVQPPSVGRALADERTLHMSMEDLSPRIHQFEAFLII